MSGLAGQPLLFRIHTTLPSRLALRLAPLRMPPVGELAV